MYVCGDGGSDVMGIASLAADVTGTELLTHRNGERVGVSGGGVVVLFMGE